MHPLEHHKEATHSVHMSLHANVYWSQTLVLSHFLFQSCLCFMHPYISQHSLSVVNCLLAEWNALCTQALHVSVRLSRYVCIRSELVMHVTGPATAVVDLDIVLVHTTATHDQLYIFPHTQKHMAGHARLSA